VVVSAGIATLAWKGLTTRSDYVAGRQLVSLDGAEGFASGRSGPGWDCPGERRELVGSICNGPVRAGAPVQVVGVKGVRLEVWGDESTALGPDNELEATIPPDADANDAAPSSHTR